MAWLGLPWRYLAAYGTNRPRRYTQAHIPSHKVSDTGTTPG